MTGFLLISVYLLVLAGFLGFDVVGKVPPILYGPLLCGMSAMAGVAIAGALSASRIVGEGPAGLLAAAAAGLAAFSATAGLQAARRMLDRK